jgi:hypothetical protein
MFPNPVLSPLSLVREGVDIGASMSTTAAYKIVVEMRRPRRSVCSINRIAASSRITGDAETV